MTSRTAPRKAKRRKAGTTIRRHKVRRKILRGLFGFIRDVRDEARKGKRSTGSASGTGSTSGSRPAPRQGRPAGGLKGGGTGGSDGGRGQAPDPFTYSYHGPGAGRPGGYWEDPNGMWSERPPDLDQDAEDQAGNQDQAAAAGPPAGQES